MQERDTFQSQGKRCEWLRKRKSSSSMCALEHLGSHHARRRKRQRKFTAEPSAMLVKPSTAKNNTQPRMGVLLVLAGTSEGSSDRQLLRTRVPDMEVRLAASQHLRAIVKPCTVRQTLSRCRQLADRMDGRMPPTRQGKRRTFLSRRPSSCKLQGFPEICFQSESP
jgi:hypothetical protein